MKISNKIKITIKSNIIRKRKNLRLTSYLSHILNWVIVHSAYIMTKSTSHDQNDRAPVNSIYLLEAGLMIPQSWTLNYYYNQVEKKRIVFP